MRACVSDFGLDRLENVLVDAMGNAKICDFGISAPLKPEFVRISKPR